MRRRSPSNRTADRFAWRTERHDEAGSASLEFVLAGVILLVPLAYLVLTLGAVQDHLLGVQSAARSTARVVSIAVAPDEAERRAALTIAAAVAEYGLDEASVETEVRCIPASLVCPAPGALVVVTVSARVALPAVPAVLGLERLGAIPVSASAAYRVPRTGGAG
ncbi:MULTISPECIES: hypothetical protein [Bacteria]|uniref:hypothetical protein n=1 Tax=Bacteria TaxID=2 RepID=UPI003C7D4E21